MYETHESLLSNPTPTPQKQNRELSYKPDINQGKPLILCVGRANDIAFLTSKAFADAFSVVFCANIETAIRTMEIARPDIVVIYVEDSLDSNIEAMHVLSSMIDMQHTPVITFSGDAKTDFAASYKAGFIECVTIPANEHQLIAKLLSIYKLTHRPVDEQALISALQDTTVILKKELEQKESTLERINSNFRFELLKRRELEQVHAVINRSLMMVSAGNHALTGARSEEELCQAICDILVEQKHYRQVWVGLITDSSDNKLQIIAHAGKEQNYETHIALNCSDHRFNCASVSKAIDNGITLINNNIPNKLACKTCWPDAKTLQFNSTISLPLKVGDTSLGVINIYSETGSNASYDEIQMLEELANDLSYGIDSLRVRNERDELIEELQDINQQLEQKVTERTHNLEIANQRLLELDKLKSLFIASMSHELRTPLNSIIGFTGIILQGMSGDLNNKQQSQLERVNNSARHLLELIVNVIDIAKLEGHRIDVYPQECRLKNIIEDVLSSQMENITKKGLRLEINNLSDVTLYSDNKRLSQAISNIVSNAVKYTENGRIAIDVHSGNRFTRISVTDTGIGIPKDQIEECFEAFERLSSHLKVKAGGTGLGLYLTRKLVTEILGGCIEVNSVPGEGSCFSLLISNDIRELHPDIKEAI
ncbi:MAG: GAF domain-containing sensor histidine kinase [Gammaproteobacteria bacterium]|nr:GAF domain-containing sensor histidine kinase [Gammaproteobacteria bacterium]